MTSGDCQLLEKLSPHLMQLTPLADESLVRLRDCANYLKQHVPAAKDAMPSGHNFMAYRIFVEQYQPKLPLEKRSAYRKLAVKANDAQQVLNAATDRTDADREAHMADKIRRDRSNTAVNYVIVGAGHLQSICARLRDLPTMLMLPKTMRKEIATLKDEL